MTAEARPVAASNTRPTRYRLSLGGRPQGFGDYAELIVARLVGRNLNKREGCLVQMGAILLLLGLLYWFVTSGLLVAIAKVVADWYGHQIKFMDVPTPTP